jgi:hypothetical protein
MTIEDTFLAETMTYINCYLSAVTKPPIIPGEDREFVHHGSPLHSAGGDTITADQEHSANSKLDSKHSHKPADWQTLRLCQSQLKHPT